jgi:hypothetical protein
MKKIFCVIISSMFLSMGGFAQISEGITSSTVIRTGNRPGEGAFGVYIGPSLSDILNITDKDISWRGLPIVNFKYYHSSQLEFRLGLQFYATSTRTKGTILDPSASGPAVTYGTRSKNSYNRITPGISYHFSSKNIVDIYLGASVVLGYDVDIKDWQSSNDISLVNKVKRTSFVMGAEAFIGLQCFVADLPLAIGLEYGISGLGEFGQKYRHEVGTVDGTTQIFYTVDGNSGSGEYSKLRSSKGNAGNDVRLTVSYYFHNNK